jgi:hypothetical protein
MRFKRVTRKAALFTALVALSSGSAQAAAAAATSCAPGSLAALRGWNGVWAAENADGAKAGISGHDPNPANFQLLGNDAPWNAAGAERMREVMRAASAASSHADAWGFPMMMASYSEFKFVISPGETTVINQYRDIRSIYTDGRGHVPEDERWSTVWGDSTGCWHGATLTVDTVGVKYNPAFNVFAAPLSEQAHFVERIRLISPGHLEDEMTITDPETLTRPWVVRVKYVPAGLDRLILDAFDDRFDPNGGPIKPPTDEAPAAAGSR